MNSKACLCVLVSAIALTGCDANEGSGGDSTGGDEGSTTDTVATTIPVTSVTDTMPDPTTAGSTSTDGTSTGTDDTSSSASDTDSSGSSTTGGTESSGTTGGTDTTGGAGVWVVEWCNLQFPPTITADTAMVTPAYARVYVEGLTDQTDGNDIDAQLQVEFGYGADDSDPAADGWTWTAGEGNPGWNGTDAGQPDNDEYQGDLQFAAAGTYDYAARVSGDGGTSWVYCDLDGLVEGGYTSDQAGNAVIE